MNITNINASNPYINQKTNTSKFADITFNTTLENTGCNGDPILEYYQNLCDKYPNITFRLSDNNNPKCVEGAVYLGYNDSFNQVGDNFGGHGQCSISIDAECIKQMMKKPQYELNILAYIEQAEQDYDSYEAETKASGMKYTSVLLEDNNGQPQRAWMKSQMPYSTEEEVRALWAQQNSSDIVKKQIENMDNDLFERLCEMLDKQKEDREELEDFYKRKNKSTLNAAYINNAYGKKIKEV